MKKKNLLVFDGQTETLLAMLSNKENKQCPYSSAVSLEQLNKDYTFEFSVPVKHEDSQHVILGNLVGFYDLDGNLQVFQIMKTEEEHNGGEVKKVCFAEHLFYEMSDDIVTDLRVTGGSAREALTKALSASRWEAGEVDDFGTKDINFYYTSGVSNMNTVVEAYGGELGFRITLKDNKLDKRYVDLKFRRGSDTGKRFEFSKDMTSVKRIEQPETDGIKTALYGRGTGEEIEETGGYTRKVTFADVVWRKIDGDPVDKPAGQEWVGLPEALAKYGRQGGTRHRFGTFDVESTDPEEILTQTYQALLKSSTENTAFELTVIALEELTGYEHEKVRLGDTVWVIDREMGITIEARVLEIKRDLNNPENTEIVLGNFIEDITDYNQKIEEIEAKITDRQGVWDKADEVVEVIIGDDDIVNTAPPVPTNVSAVGLFKTIALKWTYDPSIFIGAYEVYASKVKNFTPDSSNLVFRGKTGGYVHEGQTNETWYFRIRTMNTHGIRSAFTQEFSASTLALQEPDFENLVVTNAMIEAVSADKITFGTLDGNLATIVNLDADNITAGRLKAQYVEIGSTTKFASGYDPATKATPTQVAEAEQRAKNHAQALDATAKTTLEAYARQQAEAERIKAEAYADGVVSEEEQARIDAIEDTVEQARTLADTARQNAEKASKQYSDTLDSNTRKYADQKLVDAKTYADQKDATAKTALEAYAKAQAEAERVKAEAYADGAVSAEEQARIDAVEEALLDAQSMADSAREEAEEASRAYTDLKNVENRAYADQKKAEAITASQNYANTKAEAERVKAEAYADNVVSEEEQARIDAVEQAVETARLHAEQKAREAESASKAYSDAKLTEAQRYADQKKSEAITASEAYAKQKAEAERVLAEAHADGLVDAEEQARINAINRNLADAKTYADLKKQEAITASQGLANTAEQRAKDYSKPVMKEHYDHDFSEGKEYWSTSFTGEDTTPTTAGTIKASTESTEGANVWEISGSTSLFSRKPIPVNVNRVYRITMKIKQTVNPTTAGTSGVYLGVATLDRNFASITGGAGSHRYFGASNVQLTVDNGWQVFQGTISGVGDEANQFRAGTAFVRPMCIVNYTGGDGKVEIDYIKFEDITEMLEIEGRVVDVELRTTPESIISSVTESVTFKDIVDSKADSEYVDNTFATTDALAQTEQAINDTTDQKINDLGVPILTERVSNVEQTAERIDFKFSNSGGVNLLRNSVGYADDDFWLVTAGQIMTLQNDELAQLGAGSGWYSPQGNTAKIEQFVSVVNSSRYTVSFYMNKTKDNGTNGGAGVEVWAGETKLSFVGRDNGQLTDGWEKFTYNIDTELSEIRIVITMGAGSETVITNLMVNIGDVPLQWTLASGEVYNTNVLMDMNGIRVISNQYEGYTAITPREFSGYAEVINEETNTREMKRVFTLNRDTTEVSKVQVEEEIRMTPLKIIPVRAGVFNGWAFVPED